MLLATEERTTCRFPFCRSFAVGCLRQQSQLFFNSKIEQNYILLNEHILDTYKRSLNVLQLTWNDTTSQTMPIFIQLPCSPLPKFASKDGCVDIQNVIFYKTQFAFIELTSTIETSTEVQRITSFVFDLIEF